MGDQVATWSVDVDHRKVEQVQVQVQRAGQVHDRWLQVEAGRKTTAALHEAGLGT